MKISNFIFTFHSIGKNTHSSHFSRFLDGSRRLSGIFYYSITTLLYSISSSASSDDNETDCPNRLQISPILTSLLRPLFQANLLRQKAIVHSSKSTFDLRFSDLFFANILLFFASSIHVRRADILMAQCERERERKKLERAIYIFHNSISRQVQRDENRTI